MVPVTASCPVCNADDTSYAFEAQDLSLKAVDGLFRYRRCADCTSVFASPQPTDAALAMAYAGSYGNYREHTPVFERMLEPFALPEVRRLLRHTPMTGDLVDLGAGNARFLERIRRCGWQGSLEGIEFDPHVARLAAERTGIDIRPGDLNHHPLAEKSYDVVILRHVIEHVRQPVQTLDMVFRALRPGGILFVGTPDGSSLCARVFSKHWWGYEVPRHLVVFSNKSLSSALRRTGFNILDQWSGFSPQMWSASLGLLLADRGASERTRRFLASLVNPLTMMPACAVSAVEVLCSRSTMLNVVVQRPA